MRREVAETIALRGLDWLARDAEMLGHFCAATGADLQSLAGTADDPAALAGILDFISLDDRWVTEFADDAGIGPEQVMRARGVLSGDVPHWT